MDTTCFVCDGAITGPGEGITEMRKKGIQALAKASELRGDGKRSRLAGVDSLLIHTACRQDYTRPQSIKAFLKRSAPSPPPDPVSLRSKKQKFDFKQNCFFCGEAILKDDTKLPKHRRRKVYQVGNIKKGQAYTDLENKCKEAAKIRNDKWGEEVMGRLSSINDLVAEEAVYHDDCRFSFCKPLYTPETGESSSGYVTQAVNEISEYMEGNSDVQFSQDAIMDVISGIKPEWRTVKAELNKKYGDRIIITAGSNRYSKPVVCFRDTGDKLLNTAWYENREKNETDERLRIVRKAAAIIRQDIQSTAYDSTMYPPSDDFLKDADCIPETLKTFLEEVMLKKTQKQDQTKKKCIAISHSILATVRPRTFLSSVLNGVALLLYRKYASKNLITLLANLGFCSSYYEAQKLEMSAIAHGEPKFKPSAFSQYVFDNADFNVCTVDGLNTFHSMGGIRCICPASSVESGTEIPRLVKMPPSQETGQLGILPLQTLSMTSQGLSRIPVKHIDVPEQPSHPAPHNVLWLVAKKQKTTIPGWKGYMNCLTRGKPSEKTRVLTLPFINAPPSEYFHAACHFPYAKSCHLYVQDMENLSSQMAPEEYQKFVGNGYFTIRRSDRFWSGMWSDMTIETTLMRTFKSREGMTTGRGITDSSLSKWVVGNSATHDICESVEDFCGVLFTSDEQHKDLGEARQSRDKIDVDKLTKWFTSHPPFLPRTNIMSIASGVVGDDTITCYKAVEIGKTKMTEMETKSEFFSDIKLSRKTMALPLSSMNSSITIDNSKVAVNPYLLFQRICISKKSDEDLKIYMGYELAPYPLAFFKEGCMRKTKKSALYSLFKTTEKDVQMSSLDVVIDGGFLVHKFVWQKDSTISSICEGYVRFVKKHYRGRNCTVVFDGYQNSPKSTKVAEQNRRYRLKKCVDIQFNTETVINVKQDIFLSNSNNKSLLITFLMEKLEENGISTYQAEDDADVAIITTAIEKSVSSHVAVIGEDVDLAVLLMAKTPPECDIFSIKPGKGKVCSATYSSQELQQNDLHHILFIHAFTGCDTTSAAYRKSKVGFAKLYKRSKAVNDAAQVFTSSSSTPSQIEAAGSECILRWYGAPSKEKSLDGYRYTCFLKSVATIKPDISSLPPTEGASKYHSYRVYYQVQQWLGVTLPSDVWGPGIPGWEEINQELVPKLSDKNAAPDELLQTIFCRCQKNCDSGRCGCRKAALNCTGACINCQGSCLNRPSINEDEELEDMDPLLNESFPSSTEE